MLWCILYIRAITDNVYTLETLRMFEIALDSTSYSQVASNLSKIQQITYVSVSVRHCYCKGQGTMLLAIMFPYNVITNKIFSVD